MINDYLLGDFSKSELVSNAKDLVPVLRSRAREQANVNRVLPETVVDLRKSKILQGFQPQRWGGVEAHPSEVFEAVMTLAEGDASVAWVAGVVGVHSFHLAQFDEQAQADVWENDPTALIGSPYAPTGKATRVEGGYRLSGHWRFSSGCHLCSWTFLGANLPKGDEETSQFVGERWAAMLLPREDYEIVENWDTYGLRSTGSHDIVVHDAFVPDHRVLPFAHLADGQSPGLRTNTSHLYRFPFWQMFGRATSSVVPVGALKGMTDVFIDAARKKVSMTGAKTIEDPAAALAVAKARLAVEDGKSQLHRSFAKLEKWIDEGDVARWEERRLFRFQGSYAPSRCADAASELYRVFGGSGVYQDQPMGRQLNDILAVRSHFTNHYQVQASSFMNEILGVEGKKSPA